MSFLVLLSEYFCLQRPLVSTALTVLHKLSPAASSKQLNVAGHRFQERRAELVISEVVLSMVEGAQRSTKCGSMHSIIYGISALWPIIRSGTLFLFLLHG
ncbi:hypothetical protein K469DRAFT_346233 [Zopfia rhizophila CBS 207.26]|uniref:Uncharacterized protein n=1 Tax=Zopfia rhizophila CBS 207.26 TaxID=1314779 RepID=A0A6A6EPI4_9PEZI|nr:hypothetical protein K469DRAFT_346233 [Zopfia rhizophila CBS 207.26]